MALRILSIVLPVFLIALLGSDVAQEKERLGTIRPQVPSEGSRFGGLAAEQA